MKSVQGTSVVASYFGVSLPAIFRLIYRPHPSIGQSAPAAGPKKFVDQATQTAEPNLDVNAQRSPPGSPEKKAVCIASHDVFFLLVARFLSGLGSTLSHA